MSSRQCPQTHANFPVESDEPTSIDFARRTPRRAPRAPRARRAARAPRKKCPPSRRSVARPRAATTTPRAARTPSRRPATVRPPPSTARSSARASALETPSARCSAKSRARCAISRIASVERGDDAGRDANATRRAEGVEGRRRETRRRRRRRRAARRDRGTERTGESARCEEA